MDAKNRRPAVRGSCLTLVAVAALSACGGNDTVAPTPLPTFVPTAAGCTAMATMVTSWLPVQPAQITLARFNAAGTTSAGTTPLPDHCQVQGTLEARTGTDGVAYATKFEVRLPLSWNGRFMFQGGSGTEGSLPSATGSAGNAVPALAQGYVVMTQNGGHDNALLTSGPAFALDAKAQADYGYHSVDVATQTAKALLVAFYGRNPDRSYAVGCSTGGKQGMNLSQMFPQHYDGIVAGDPIYNQGANTLSENNALQAIAAIVTKDTAGKPRYYESFTSADYQLVSDAILGACDALDGTADGIVDNWQACKFDPATYVSPTGQALQCTGAKTATCLTAAQVGALKRISIGPRTAAGAALANPFKADGSTVAGYMYDGGFMTANSGIPSRDIGTVTAQPGNIGFAAVQIPYMWMSPPVPSFDPLLLNYDSDMLRMSLNSVMVSNSPDLSAFKARNGKIIYYHGQSDPGPPVLHTVGYYERLMAANGGLAATQVFARLFLVPGMGHCSGGPAPDQFDPLSAIVNWVEKGTAPDSIAASGSNFALAPKTRSRPLCPYPQYAKYIGPAGGDLGAAANYACRS